MAARWWLESKKAIGEVYGKRGTLVNQGRRVVYWGQHVAAASSLARRARRWSRERRLAGGRLGTNSVRQRAALGAARRAGGPAAWPPDRAARGLHLRARD